jgi:hypothetical protein
MDMCIYVFERPMNVVIGQRRADGFGTQQQQMIVTKDQARWCPWFCLASEQEFRQDRRPPLMR